jgi:hypothetical protein
MNELRAFCQQYPELPALLAMGILLAIYFLGRPNGRDGDGNDSGYNIFD